MNTARKFRQFIALLLSLGFALGSSYKIANLQENPAERFHQLVSDVRLVEGQAPLSWSKLLTQAAQRHADDMAANSSIDHQGSDGSTYQQRIRDTGYKAWNEGLLVNESIWAGLGTEEDALAWFRNDPEHWEIFTDPRYREVGIGYSEDNQGVHYFVINFGARPGVLPVFINDGKTTTDSAQVAVRLTNEDAIPLGDGNWVGNAIEIRLSNTPEFDNTPWQPWESLVPWQLENTEPGDYAIYVEFRDGAGRTAISQDTIRLTTQDELEGVENEATAPPTVENTDIPDLPPATPTLESTTTPEGNVPEPTSPPEEITTVPTITTEPQPTPVPQATWTSVTDLTQRKVAKPVDWALISIFALQGIACILGIALFLRRR